MEINMSELGGAENRICIIMDRTTLLDKGIHIPNLDWFMWIHMKQNYNNHVERMENWKDIGEEEEWTFK
jgi:hypothetical protein